MSQPITYKSLADIAVIEELNSSDTILIEQNGHYRRMPASMITELLNQMAADEISATDISAIFAAVKTAK